jgi:hypothetical protein
MMALWNHSHVKVLEMRWLITGVALIFLLIVPGAHADQAKVGHCVASLPPEARLVFNAVNATPPPQKPLRRVLEARVRELVFMDRLTVHAARPAAEAASECLRMARNCTGETC